MMDERPAPRWVVWLIRVVQGDQGAIEGAAIGVALALALMMAIEVLAAWQAGRL